MAQNDIYLVRQKADGTFEEIAHSPFQYDASSITDLPDKASNTFHINTKLRVDELEVNGKTTVIHTDTNTSEQLLVTNDGTGPAAIINQLGQQALIDIQDDGHSALYIRGDAPFGGFVGLGETNPQEQLHLSGSMLLENTQLLMSKNISGTKVNILGLTNDDVTNLNNVGNGITLSTGTASSEEKVFIHPSGRVGIGILKNDPGAVLELKRDSDTNLLFTHKTTSISSIINIDKPEDKVVFKTLSDNDLSLGTNALDFFTLTKEGNITLEQKTSGSTLTGGDLTIDGTFTSKGDMISIGSEEILFSKSLMSSGMNVAKSYRILEVGYNTQHWDHGTSFVVEVYSNHYSSQGYQKYLLSHTYLDTSAGGSQDGIVDKTGSRDYVLKILEHEGDAGSYEFRVRLGSPEDTGVNVNDFDVALVPLYVDVTNYANVRVKVTSFNSDSCKRISFDSNWGAATADDEFKFNPLPPAEDITWSDYPDLPGTLDYVFAGRQALYADVLFGDGRINRIGEGTTHQNNIQWALKLADVNTSLTVAGKVGIGTGNPTTSLHIKNSQPVIRLEDTNTGLSSEIYGDTGDGDLVIVSDVTGGGTDPFMSFRIGGMPLANEKMRIQENGNVGIGTKTPDRKLDVQGIQGWEDSNGVERAGLNPAIDGSDFQLFDSNGDSSIRFDSRSGGNSYINNGNVGIGTATPSYKLDVSTESSVGLRLKNPASAGVNLSNDAPSIFFQANGWDTDAGSQVYSGRIRVSGLYSGAGDRGNTHPVMVFDLETNENNPDDVASPKMSIGIDAVEIPTKLGIGTTSPSTTLDINQPKNDSNGNALNKDVIMSFSKGETGEARIGLSGAGSQVLLGSEADDLCIRSDGNNIRFGTASATRTDMTIDSAGKVGIGTTSPRENLEVNGNVLIASYDVSANTGEAPGSMLTIFSRREPASSSNNALYGSGIDFMPRSDGGHCSPFIRFYDTKSNTDYDSDQVGDNNWIIGADDTNVSSFMVNWGGGSDSDKPESISSTSELSGFKRLFIDGPTGRFGLNTSSPQSDLHLGNSSASSNWMTFQNSPGSFQIGISETNTPSEKYFSIYDKDASEHRIFVADSGNVGIGTSSPGSALHVAGEMGVSPLGTGVHAGVRGAGADSRAILQLNGELGGYIDFSKSGTDLNGRILYDNTDDYMEFYTNQTRRMHIDGLGNVGIGTTSPTCALDIYRPDSQISEVRIRGGVQGSGTLFVGQSDHVGGGIMYNGDDIPNQTISPSAGFPDRTTLFRRNGGDDSAVMQWGHDNSDVTFYGGLFINSNIYHSEDSNTWMGFHTADQWRVVTGGTERLEVNNIATTVNNVLQAYGGMTIATNEDNNTPELTLKRTAATNSNSSDDIVDIRVADSALNFIINNDSDGDGGTYQFQKMAGGLTVPAAINCDTITTNNIIRKNGDTNTYLEFHEADQFRVVTGGFERLEVTNQHTKTAGDLIVEGDLTVNGDLVTLNTTNLQIEDKLLTVAKNATNAATADGCGLDFGGQYKLTFENESVGNKLLIDQTNGNQASLEIQGTGGTQLILQDTNSTTTANQTGKVEWKLGNDTVTAEVGFRSNSDSDFSIRNGSGDIVLLGQDTRLTGTGNLIIENSNKILLGNTIGNSNTSAADAYISIFDIGANNNVKLIGFSEGENGSAFWFNSGFALDDNLNFIGLSTSTNTNAMTWTYDGRIGINTTNPEGRFEINHTGSWNDPSIHLKGQYPTIKFNDTNNDSHDWYIHANDNKFYIMADRDGHLGDDPITATDNVWEAPYPLQLNSSTNEGYIFGYKILSSFGGEINGNLQVRTRLDVGNGTHNDSEIRIYKQDNNTSDHIQFYNGTTRMGEIGCHDTTWLRINQETNKNIYTPRMIRADGGFHVDQVQVIDGNGNIPYARISGAPTQSENNFTTALKNKLDGIATGATNTAAPHYTSAIAVGDGGLTQKNFTTTLKNKLDGIDSSATNTAAPAIIASGSTVSLAAGVSQSAIRNAIGAGTGSGSANGTVTNLHVGSGLDVSNSTTTPNITLDFRELTLAPLVFDTWDFILKGFDNASEPVRVNFNTVVQSIGLDLSPNFVGTGTGVQTMLGTLEVQGGATGESIRAAGDIVALASMTSDDALKTNKVAIDGALDKVCSLNGFTFDWNEKAAEIGIQEEGSIGLSAQEIEKVVPEVVKPLSNTEYKYVNYEKLVPVLVEAIKELKSEIEQLKSNQCDC